MYLNILQSPAISHEKTRNPSKLPSPYFTSIKASFCYNSIPLSHSPSLSVDSPLPFPCSLFPLPLGRLPSPIPCSLSLSVDSPLPFPCSLFLVPSPSRSIPPVPSPSRSIPLSHSHVPCSLFPLPLGRFPLFPLPLGRFPSRFLSFPFPCSLSLSVSLMPLFSVGFPVFPLCFSRHLCTKKQILKKKKQDKDSRGNRAPPSQFSSLSPPATIQKQREQGLIFNASTRDMVAGSGDGVTGRGCFLLGKID